MRKNILFRLLLLPLLPLTAQAQFMVSGKVIGAVNNKPVPNASVFLSDASVGTRTDSTGTFRLYHVKKGQYDLVVSCIGFETYHKVLMMNGEAIILPEISLLPKTTQLKEVKIKYDPNHKAHLEQFKQEFLGHSANARQCSILNPEIIDLDYDKKADRITGSTDDFLIIENKALGYRIKYLLKTFLCDPVRVNYYGSSTFELMKGTPPQEKKWEDNRLKAYMGSNMQFLRSCITNTSQEEGFAIFPLTRKINTDRPNDSLVNIKVKMFGNFSNSGTMFMDSLAYWRGKKALPKIIQQLHNDSVLVPENFVKLTAKTGIYAIGYPECLYITNTHNIKQFNIVTFNAPYAFFDNNGVVLNPEAYVMEGYWATQRIAELLPVDYEPPPPPADN